MSEGFRPTQNETGLVSTEPQKYKDVAPSVQDKSEKRPLLRFLH